MAVGKWETCFWFSTFPSACFRWSCGNVGISPVLGEIPKGLWKEGEACFWLSTLSTAPAFPRLSRLALLYEARAAVKGYCGPASFFFLLFFSR